MHLCVELGEGTLLLLTFYYHIIATLSIYCCLYIRMQIRLESVFFPRRFQGHWSSRSRWKIALCHPATRSRYTPRAGSPT